MIKEAIEYLFGLGKAAAPSVVTVPAEPPHVYYVRKPDGTLERRYADLPPHNRTAHNLTALAELATHIVSDEEINFAVFYSPTAVVLAYGDRDRMTLPIKAGAAFEVLTQLGQRSGSYTQAQLAQVLRTTFRGTFEAQYPTLIDVFKRVTFKSGQATVGEVAHGKASLGKEIYGEVTGFAAIPEYVTFTVPVFAARDFAHIRREVTVAVTPDTTNGQFVLATLPGHIEDALATALDDVEVALVEAFPKGTRIYQATP